MLTLQPLDQASISAASDCMTHFLAKQDIGSQAKTAYPFFLSGWTFFIALIPFIGDLIDALLGYNLVIKPAKKADIVSAVTPFRHRRNVLMTTETHSRTAFCEGCN